MRRAVLLMFAVMVASPGVPSVAGDAPDRTVATRAAVALVRTLP
jgi:hypothetical protein